MPVRPAQFKRQSFKKVYLAQDNGLESMYTYQWKKSRKLFLQLHPLCVYCNREGMTTPATVVDHIQPHKGNLTLFWDTNNWQALCKRHHDSDKQREDKRNQRDQAQAKGY